MPAEHSTVKTIEDLKAYFPTGECDIYNIALVKGNVYNPDPDATYEDGSGKYVFIEVHIIQPRKYDYFITNDIKVYLDDTEGRQWLMRLARSALGAVASINRGAIGVA